MRNSSKKQDHQRLYRDRYRVFIEDVADGFFETDLKGNFLYFNNALCRIFDYPREHIQNHGYRKFMDAENAEIALKRFNTIYRTGQGETGIIWQIVRKDGERRILEISANLIYDDQDAPVGFRGIARDITEKHHAQLQAMASEQQAQCQYEASRRAEQRYRAFLNFLPDPVFVFNLDSTVSYLNPAFERVFGWTLKELKGKRIPFVPDEYREQTRLGVERLFKEKSIHGFETKRLTRDGRLLDIVIDGAIFYDENDQPAGQVVTLRDVTKEKNVERTNRTLSRIAAALHHYRGLDGLLAFITKEVQDLLAVEAASVILLDEEREEFYFFAITHDDSDTGKRFKEIRFPADAGVAGQVYKTGKPLVVHDTSKSPYYYQKVDQKAGFHTRNMLDVPVQIHDRMIGVLCTVNKKAGSFGQEDVDLLSTIANSVALPIENARINQELQNSYDEVRSLNRAKDQVIHRLSHELKTPISVLSASLSLLAKKLLDCGDKGFDRIIERSQRNLQRLLDMQYETEDILRERDLQAHQMLSILLDTCADELESLVAAETNDESVAERIRRHIEDRFGPRDVTAEEVFLDRQVETVLQQVRPRFSHRRLDFREHVEPVGAVWIPVTVLDKIITGLVRNAVENTPDGSRIDVSVRWTTSGPEFEVKDCGVGISAENQRLVLENFVPATDVLHYSTRKPYDFNAGGRGFDLLRIKIFSERYHFKIQLTSNRCRYIAGDKDACPGGTDKCSHCSQDSDCLASGGTTVTVTFQPYHQQNQA